VQDGITETNHGVIDYLVVTSTEFWEGMPDDVRSKVEQIFAEVTAESNAKSNQLNEEAREEIAGAGVEIRELTPEQRQKWIDAMKPVWDEFADDIGQDNIDAAMASNQGA
jgi:C4-dicarboxylate-binding protein DctP